MIIKFLGNLKNIVGVGEIEANLSTIDNIDKLLKLLVSKYGSELERELLKDGKIRKDITILINGRNVRFLKGVNTEININDRNKVVIFSTIAGG